MSTIGTALSMSLVGFTAGPDGGAVAASLHDWLTAGETPSRFNPSFRMARRNAEFFDEGSDGSSDPFDDGGVAPGEVPLVIVRRRCDPEASLLDAVHDHVSELLELDQDRVAAALGHVLDHVVPDRQVVPSEVRPRHRR